MMAGILLDYAIIDVELFLFCLCVYCFPDIFMITIILGG